MPAPVEIGAAPEGAEGFVVDPSPLQQLAIDAGRTWASARCAELAREGRLVVGGWPGTMSEARIRIAGILGRSGSTGITAAERDVMVRGLYCAARNAWLSCAAPDEEL